MFPPAHPDNVRSGAISSASRHPPRPLSVWCIYRHSIDRCLPQVLVRHASNTLASETLRVSSFVLLMRLPLVCVRRRVHSLGARMLSRTFILAAPGGRWGAFLMVMIVVFCLACSSTGSALCSSWCPSSLPSGLRSDSMRSWFGMLICVNLHDVLHDSAVRRCHLRLPGHCSAGAGSHHCDNNPWRHTVRHHDYRGSVMCTVWPEIIHLVTRKMIS